MSTSPMPPFRGLWWGPHLEKPAPELHLQSSLEQEEARTMPGRAVRALGSHSRLLSRGGAPTTRGWKVGQPRGEEGTWVSGTSSPQPHPMVSTGPRGQMASSRPGPWLSLIQMSYERVEWAAASGVGGAVKTIAGRPQDNGSHVPWGQQSFVTQWTSRGQQPGQLLPPTRAGRVFKSFPGCVFL